MNYDVIIVASGKGKRADLGFNKILFEMCNGKKVIENTAEIFLNDEDCKKVIIVSNDEININDEKVIIINGGKERSDSVSNGLNEVESEYVLIHDGARPFLRKETLEELKNQLSEKDAVIVGKKASDTIKMINGDMILSTIDRRHIFLAETPQGFKTSLIKECYRKRENKIFSDDASLVEVCGYPVYIVDNKFDNKKLTNKEDFENI